MSKRSFLKLLLSLLLLIQTFGASTTFEFSKVKAQQDQPRFLTTPYYGNKVIKALFDHHYPTGYTQTDGEFANFSGKRWTRDVSIGTCGSCSD